MIDKREKIKVLKGICFHGRNVGLGGFPIRFKAGTYDVAVKVADWMVENGHAERVTDNKKSK